MNGFRILLTLILLFLLAGCSSEEPTPTPVPTPTPAEIAAQAGREMLALNSMHFVIELDGKAVYLDSPPTIILRQAEGDVVRPDSVRATAQVSMLGMASEVAIIGLGDQQYITNPFNQQWEKLAAGQGWDFDPALIFDSQVGLEAILTGSSWERCAPSDIEEQAHDCLAGQLAGETIAPLASGMIGAGRVDVQIWAGQQDHRVRRIDIVELDSDPEEPTHWLLTFGAFDELDAIKAPPLP